MANNKDLFEDASEIKTTIKPKEGKLVSSFRLVNLPDCKRISMSNKLYNGINNPKSIQVLAKKKERQLLIGEKLPNAKASYPVKGTSHPLIYNSRLVEEISSTFGLITVKNRSKVFLNIVFDEYEGSPIAIISMVEE